MRANKGRAVKQAVSVFLLVATLSVHLLPAKALQYPRWLMLDAVGAPAAPIYITTAAVTSFLSAPFSGGASRQDLEKRIVSLTSDLARKQSEIARLKSALALYADFKYLPDRQPFLVYGANIAGHVIGGDADVFSRSYVISAGSREGIQRGLPVVYGNVAIGVTSDVGAFNSRVRILGDPRSRICVRFARSGIEGVLAGTGRSTSAVRFIPNTASDLDIAPGDLVVTSGTDGIFPPDVAVGTVTRFVRRHAEPDADVEVELLADFSRIENCLVLKRTVSSKR